MPVPQLRDARLAGWVNCFSICVSTMPQNSAAKGSILMEDEILCRSGYIIYLCCRCFNILKYCLTTHWDCTVILLHEHLSWFELRPTTRSWCLKLFYTIPLKMSRPFSLLHFFKQIILKVKSAKEVVIIFGNLQYKPLYCTLKMFIIVRIFDSTNMCRQ